MTDNQKKKPAEIDGQELDILEFLLIVEALRPLHEAKEANEEPPTELSEKDRELAEMMGMTPEEFQQWRMNAYEKGWDSYEAYQNSDIEWNFSGNAWEQYTALLKHEEGFRRDVYRCSEGYLTVGIGHLLSEDEKKIYKEGDVLSDEQIAKLFEEDASEAYNAALSQAAEIGLTDPKAIAILGSVNFQLGIGWRDKFSNTWQAIKDGHYEEAARMVENSLWAEQTEDRALTFADTIRTDFKQNIEMTTAPADATRVATQDFDALIDKTLSTPD